MKVYLGIDTLRIEDGAVDFLDTDASGSCTVEVTHCVQTDVTETLIKKKVNKILIQKPLN